ncbi:type IX secretion system anionic LPS delivery protein PorZ [Nonlabens xiamenensis]|uniref:type IX secretion system anionic LPS delivery protein PorZ n=1 Tax=Nonlabens xiamenensis TaxID=2341043 RepID=UPI000F60D257|nr:T9SS type A sorting domain-containing protein [Nonlabens xiamenensis]
MRYLFLLLLLSSHCLVKAQDFSDSWTGLFSFNNIVDIDESSSTIYAASQNAIFLYDLGTRSFETLTTVNGLSGDDISQIHYSESTGLLVIGYVNGLIQIVSPDDEVTSVVAIKDKQTIPPDRKRINEFKESGDLIYIATDFGIAIYDLSRLEFDDTYFIGDNASQLRIASLEIDGGFLYAATLDGSGGMRRAPINNPFLIDFANWQQINNDTWNEVFQFDDRLLATTVGRFFSEFNGSQFAGTGIRFPRTVRDASSSDGRLVITMDNQVIVLDSNLQQSLVITDIDGQSYTYTAGLLRDDRLYLGTTDSGVLEVNINDLTDVNQINADGPTRNRVFSVSSAPGELWVGYGDYNVFYNPFPLESFGISHFVEEEGWENFGFDEVLGIRSIGNITINPADPAQLFLNSLNDGMVEFVDDTATTLFDNTNSTFVPTDDNGRIFFRIPDSEFDQEGNLWVLQSFTGESLHRRSTSGQWTSFDLENDLSDIATSGTKMVITRSGNIIYGTTFIGLIGYDTSNDRAVSFKEQNNLVNNYIGALRIDLNGQLWIGSNLGLRVLFSAESIFQENPPDARAIIIEDTNGIARELLADVAVLDIEVDGNNNKWVATSGSGAFLFSPSGRETIFQFTTNNSPLPTNTVNDIAIDEETGKVYFATDKGLVAFQGQRSSKPQEDLEMVRAFPNPVRPGFDGNVTIDGLTDRARVKITDIEGNLVYEAISQGGSIPWDTRSFSGNKVASGVYLLLISTDDFIETKVAKLMIIR